MMASRARALLVRLPVSQFLPASLVSWALALSRLILTSTLPYALASNQSKLALRLNPKNPPALLAEAKKLRDDLVRLLATKTAAEQVERR